MKKNKAAIGGKTWTFPRSVQFCDLGFTPGLPTLPSVTTALESYLDLLLVQARYGRKLLGKYPLAFEARKEIEKLDAIISDKSLPAATRKRLIREREASLGVILRLAAKHGRVKQIANVMSKRFPRQTNQEQVFNSYRAVLRREGRRPTIPEWVEQDYADRPLNVSCEIEHNPKKKKTWIAQRNPKEQEELIRTYKRKRGNVIREMQKRFNLPVTRAS